MCVCGNRGAREVCVCVCVARVMEEGLDCSVELGSSGTSMMWEANIIFFKGDKIKVLSCSEVGPSLASQTRSIP